MVRKSPPGSGEVVCCFSWSFWITTWDFWGYVVLDGFLSSTCSHIFSLNIAPRWIPLDVSKGFNSSIGRSRNVLFLWTAWQLSRSADYITHPNLRTCLVACGESTVEGSLSKEAMDKKSNFLKAPRFFLCLSASTPSYWTTECCHNTPQTSAVTQKSAECIYCWMWLLFSWWKSYLFSKHPNASPGWRSLGLGIHLPDVKCGNPRRFLSKSHIFLSEKPIKIIKNIICQHLQRGAKWFLKGVNSPSLGV